MPRWFRSWFGGLEPEERRTLGPGYSRMRAGGRGEFTFFTKTPQKSRRAIGKTWSSLAREASSHKEVFFRHIFSHLTTAQLRSLRRMRITRDQLVETMADPANRKWLHKVVSHNKVVEGTKAAADRFLLKNISLVLMRAAKGRRGSASFSALASPGSSRDDIASALIAAIEHHGLPAGEREAPQRGRRATRRQRREEEQLEEPAAPTQPDVPEAPTSPYGAEEPYGAGEAQAPQPQVTPATEEPASVSEQLFGPKRIRIAQLAQSGLIHHPESRSFFHATDTQAKRREIGRLVDAAGAFVGDLMSLSLTRNDVGKLANHALNASDYSDFSQRVAATVEQSERAISPQNLHHVLQRGIGETDLSIENWHSLDIPERKKGALAFFLLARLAKLSDDKKARVHLKRFVLASHDTVRDGVRDAYKLVYQPTAKSMPSSDLLRLLRTAVLHGNTTAATAGGG